MDSEEMLNLILNEINEVKGDKPAVLDVRKMTDITDYMLVVGGNSNRHIKAIYEHVFDLAKRHMLPIIGSEGIEDKEWVLLDLNSIVIHIMSHEKRELYQIESLWSISLE